MMSSNLSWKIYIHDENLVDRLTYKKWSQTDRAELETLVKKVDEFISSFLGHFKVYQKHAFTAKNSPISKGKKGNLKEGEVLAVCDFAENYS